MFNQRTIFKHGLRNDLLFRLSLRSEGEVLRSKIWLRQTISIIKIAASGRTLWYIPPRNDEVRKLCCYFDFFGQRPIRLWRRYLHFSFIEGVIYQ